MVLSCIVLLFWLPLRLWSVEDLYMLNQAQYKIESDIWLFPKVNMKLNFKKNWELGLAFKSFENYSLTLCHMPFGLSVLISSQGPGKHIGLRIWTTPKAHFESTGIKGRFNNKRYNVEQEQWGRISGKAEKCQEASSTPWMQSSPVKNKAIKGDGGGSDHRNRRQFLGSDWSCSEMPGMGGSCQKGWKDCFPGNMNRA